MNLIPRPTAGIKFWVNCIPFRWIVTTIVQLTHNIIGHETYSVVAGAAACNDSSTSSTSMECSRLNWSIISFIIGTCIFWLQEIWECLNPRLDFQPLWECDCWSFSQQSCGPSNECGLSKWQEMKPTLTLHTKNDSSLLLMLIRHDVNRKTYQYIVWS